MGAYAAPRGHATAKRRTRTCRVRAESVTSSSQAATSSARLGHARRAGAHVVEPAGSAATARRGRSRAGRTPRAGC
jgi:hypothetical protein